MYMAGLSGTICTLSIKQLPGWLLDQTHTRCSWVQWPVDLPIVHQSGSCGALVSLGCAMAFTAAVSGWTVTQALHIPASLEPDYFLPSLKTSAWDTKSEWCSYPQGLSEQKLSHWEVQGVLQELWTCCVTLRLATGTRVLKHTLQFQGCVVCHLVRDSAHFNMSLGRGKWKKTLIPTCKCFFFFFSLS